VVADASYFYIRRGRSSLPLLGSAASSVELTTDPNTGPVAVLHFGITAGPPATWTVLWHATLLQTLLWQNKHIVAGEAEIMTGSLKV